MTINSFSAGINTSFSSELNSNFNSSKIIAVSTSSLSTTTLEYDAIPSSTLEGADYVEVYVTGTARAQATSANDAQVNLIIESKEVGSTYSTDLNLTLNQQDDTSNNNTHAGDSIAGTWMWVHTLTSGEKSNGVQFRLSVSLDNGGGVSSAFTTAQVVFKVAY